MAKTVCKAKKTGQVKERGKASIEWHDDGVPQYYCMGYLDASTEELLPVCSSCKDNVIYAQEDLDKANAKRRENQTNETNSNRNN